MQRRHFLAASAALATAGAAGLKVAASSGAGARVEDVMAVERAFAQSMADRDFEAFARFIDDEAEFLNGGSPLHGKPAILEFWKRHFTAPKAPFSWAPDQAVVLASGTLAATEGPVLDPQGNNTARFYTTWRRDAQGEWKVVFDNGYATCAA